MFILVYATGACQEARPYRILTDQEGSRFRDFSY